MKEQREELLNQRRFGVTSDGAVQDKLKEIFHTELDDLTKTDEYDVPQGTVDVVKKLIDNVDQADPETEEGIFLHFFYYTYFHKYIFIIKYLWNIE